MSADVRTESFTPDGRIRVDVQLTSGSLDVDLTGPDDVVQVEVRHDPASGQPWTQGLASALSWVNEQFGDQFDADLTASAAAAVEQTRVELQRERLVVQAPKALPLRHLPLAVTVRAPAGSLIAVRAASARVDVTGTASVVDVTTSAGDVVVAQPTGPLTVRTGSGAVSVAGVESGAASSSIVTGSGAASVGSVESELNVRTGSGSVAVADAASGTLTVKSGSGDVRIGVRSGVLAEVHLSSATGRASSELDVEHTPPAETASLRVFARSGHGSVTVCGPTE